VVSTDLNNLAVIGSDGKIYVPTTGGGTGADEVAVQAAQPTDPDIVFWIDPTSGSGTSLSHSNLSGLAADDHPQYLNTTRGDARYPVKAGGVFTASFGVTTPTGNADVSIEALTGQAKRLVFKTSPNLPRWALSSTNTTETGSDAGSALALDYYTDAGVFKGTALAGSRATGLLTVKGDPTAPLGVASKQYVDAKVINSSSGAETTEAMSVNAAKAYTVAYANAKVVDSTGGASTTQAPSVAAVNGALLNKVSTAGGTMTGALVAPELRVAAVGSNNYAIVDGDAGRVRGVLLRTSTSARWIAGASSGLESGSNAGSDFVLQAYNDAGGLLGDRLTISRATGAATFAGDVVASKASGDARMLVSGPALSNLVLGLQTADAMRWAIYASGSPESSTATGSDLVINRYNNVGTYIDSPLIIERATGKVTMTGWQVSTSAPSGVAPAGSVWIQY